MKNYKQMANKNKPPGNPEWKPEFKKQLPFFGHRNWILVVDKAFPAQNAEGIITLDTGCDLLEVLNYVMNEIDNSSHIKPVIYKDKELDYITKEQISEIDNYRKSLYNAIGEYEPQVMLHNSVFVKIDEASKLFKVMVLKTNETIPYSSVFIELDCKYWSAGKEEALRKAMRE
jgi:L-fucose mutarotase/ribose pyranase (RbsD/FucU family)